MRRYLFFIIFLLFSVFTNAERLLVEVTAYNKCSISGDLPEGVEVQYMQYQSAHHKGRLLAGDSAVLEIKGMPQGRIIGVTMQMHSNQSAGAGQMCMTVGGLMVWNIEDETFASPSWYGAYSSSFVEISKTFDSYVPISDIRISISSSVNSLYIQSFTIDYLPLSDMACEVRFNTYSDTPCRPRTEASPGAGVVLPSIPNLSDEWFFIGWMNQWCPMTNIAPEYMSAGSVYYPRTDITLHALYATSRSGYAALEQVTEIASGRYALGVAIVKTNGDIASRGILTGGKPGSSHKLETLSCDISLEGGIFHLSDDMTIPEDAVYILTFDGDSLRIVHEQSERTLGYNDRYLTNDTNRWAWKETESHRVIVYHDYNEQTDIASVLSLYPSNALGDDMEYYGKVSNMFISDNNLGFILFPAEMSESTDVWYASEPTLNALEYVNEKVLQDLHAPMTVYDVCGRTVISGVVNMSDIPVGIWFVRHGDVVEKIIR